MKSLLARSGLVAVAFMAPAVHAQPAMQEMSGVMRVVNMAPEGGTCQTPVWVGIHNGNFDIYDSGVQASSSLEALAEEGVVLPLVRDFDRTPGGVWDGVVGDGPICPGDSIKMKFTLSFVPGETLYVSYASMVIPSNDAFVANGNPMEHALIGPDGMPAFEEDMLKIRVRGREVLDAGTELNDELPENTAFFGQTSPNSGVSTIPLGGVVALHPGFKPQGEGGILDSGNFANADFTADSYKMMRLVILFPEGGASPDEDDEGDASPDDDEQEEPGDDEEEESPDDDEEEEPDDDEEEESPDDDEGEPGDDEEEESPDDDEEDTPDDEPEVSVDSPDDETDPPVVLPTDGGLRQRRYL